ncbi:MAG: hypothetical protein OXI43_12310 [Candidatus Poribacteria bacterium]|nr:hypothetical protein [Candidatus Poribacteria bacterium]
MTVETKINESGQHYLDVPMSTEARSDAQFEQYLDDLLDLYLKYPSWISVSLFLFLIRVKSKLNEFD